MTKIADDGRLDPRIRRIMGVTPDAKAGADVADRDELLAKANSESALAARAMIDANLDRIDSTDLAPLEGLDISTHEFVSAPDGNSIKVSFMRPHARRSPEPENHCRVCITSMAAACRRCPPFWVCTSVGGV